MADFGQIDYAVTDHIATIVINRPDAMNAMTDGLYAELADTYRRFNEDGEARVAILRGAGERAFSVGRDIKERARLLGETGGVRAGTQFPVIEKPIIAAVQGYALGLGIQEALRCDLRIASETARFGLTEVRIGQPGPVDPVVRVLGFGPALYMLLTGAHVEARLALQFNLVLKVVPQEQLLDAAWDLAQTIAANAPLAVRITKQNAYHARFLPPELAAPYLRVNSQIAAASDDFREGARAFAEKRAPVWTGR